MFRVTCVFMVCLFLVSLGQAEDKAWLQAASKRCNRSGAPWLFSDSYGMKFTMNQKEVIESWDKVYHSSRRIPNRVFFDKKNQNFVAPAVIHSRSPESYEIYVPIPDNVLVALKNHIEAMLERGYLDYVFPADLSSAFLFIDGEQWQKINGGPESYFRLLAHGLNQSSLRMLYRNAMRFDFSQVKSGAVGVSRHLKWRFFNRNVWGDLQGDVYTVFAEKNDHNTYRLPRDSQLRPTGSIEISANHLGCFSFVDAQGKTRYFDISVQGQSSSPEAMELERSGQKLKKWY